MKGIFRNWGDIGHQDLSSDKKNLSKEWYPNTPFFDIIKKSHKIKGFENDFNCLIYKGHMYTIIINMGMFFGKTKYWTDKSVVNTNKSDIFQMSTLDIIGQKNH